MTYHIMMQPVKKSKLQLDLENIITVDGRGRARKAKLLIEVLDTGDISKLKLELEKMLKLPY